MDPSKEPVDKKWCGVRELDAGKGTAAGRPFPNKNLFLEMMEPFYG